MINLDPVPNFKLYTTRNSQVVSHPVASIANWSIIWYKVGNQIWGQVDSQIRNQVGYQVKQKIKNDTTH